MKTHYELLGLSPAASAEDIRTAFRQIIARYHPDKVQHLGQEFQEMAVTRAADLTAAYHVLSNAERRAAYDATLGDVPSSPAAPAHAAEPAVAPPRPAPSDTPKSEPATDEAGKPPRVEAPRFARERAWRDELVRKATLDRFRSALTDGLGGYAEAPAGAFDVAATPKSKLFARTKGPRLVGRFVSRVDGASVAETWSRVGKLGLLAGDEVCIMLMGTEVASASELADAIAEQRRRQNKVRITVIPVDANSWDAHVPTDAPAAAKTLLTRLRAGNQGSLNSSRR